MPPVPPVKPKSPVPPVLPVEPVCPVPPVNNGINDVIFSVIISNGWSKYCLDLIVY